MTSKKLIKKLWVEKYRPKTLDNVIMPSNAHLKKFKSFIDSGEIPNLLLIGSAGTGKTTISKVLVRELGMHRNDVLRINCSDEKIDAMREKVKGFSMTMPIGKFKIVQLEEFDNIGLDAQKLLRSLIEDCSSVTRFIATCNYANQLMPPIRSRFQEFAFNAPSLEEVIIRCADILEQEQVQFEIEDLEQIVGLAYPDFRKVIQLLEGSSINGKLKLDKDTDAVSDWKIQLLELLQQGNFNDARKVVCNSASKEELVDVYQFLATNIHTCKGLAKNLNGAYVLLAKYQYRHNFVAYGDLQITALFIKLQELISK